MTGYLVISALGQDRPGIIERLSRLVADNQCNIHDSRMTVLGGEFAILLMVSGNQENLESLESNLPATADELELKTLTRRTGRRLEAGDSRPYKVEVVSLDHPGIVQRITSFFSQRNVNIETMETGTYAAPHTGSTMFSLNFVVNIPQSTNIREMRDEFLEFCDERNLDASIEHVK